MLAACAKYNKIAGIFLFGTDRVSEFLRKGFTLISIGNDRAYRFCVVLFNCICSSSRSDAVGHAHQKSGKYQRKIWKAMGLVNQLICFDSTLFKNSDHQVTYHKISANSNTVCMLFILSKPIRNTCQVIISSKICLLNIQIFVDHTLGSLS